MKINGIKCVVFLSARKIKKFKSPLGIGREPNGSVHTPYPTWRGFFTCMTGRKVDTMTVRELRQKLFEAVEQDAPINVLFNEEEHEIENVSIEIGGSLISIK